MRLFVALLFLANAVVTWGQTPRPAPSPNEEFLSNKPSNTPTSLAGAEYHVGRDDLLEVAVFEIPELGATTRVSASGVISLPLIGTVEAAGLTQQELERLIEKSLKEKYVNDPHVNVLVREYASQPVSILGAVKLPGIYQIKGQRYLLDMLAMAGGVDTSSGRTIQVIRAPKEHVDANNAKAPEREMITIDSEDLNENGITDLNIPIYANDVINVLRAGSIFVVGEVVHPNEFVLRNGKNVTVIQAVGLGSGFTRDAKKKEASVIRVHRDGSREEIPVNVEKILQGAAPDLELASGDILFIPANRVKSALNRTLDATISVVTGRLIYGVR
jgi:polysaccharide export outer membrane protein